LQEERAPTLGTATIGAPVAQLDVETAIKASQAVSGEIVLENLIKTLMAIAIEHAGAERGLLILPRGDKLWVEAEATTGLKTVEVNLRQALAAPSELPLSILQYVIRTQEPVIADDASREKPFSADEYVASRHVRSVLCLPLIKQAKLVGVLYIENNVAASVFTPARIAVLKLLASQAAISLDNARLYRDLAEREAKIRRLVDANIIGIFIWDFEGRILEANDAFLRIVGYDRQDLAAARINWADLTPSDWRERDAQWIEEHKRTGLRPPIEKEYFRKDGSRAPVLLAAASFGDSDNEGVAFVLDLTERKEAEAALGEMQAQLAHANRVATMGQLTASIAHEVNQPIAATVTNAEAALRFLNARQPDLDEVRDALRCIVRDGERAGDVLGRIRALIKGAQPLKEHVQIDVAIREVIELTRSEAMKNGVLVQTEFVEDLPPVQGDRVELQQVILNLILNAIEAMSETNEGPREMLITTERAEPGDVLVAVRDSGPGLAPGALENLFKAFHTTKPNGLGLGLSISRSIVEAHDGRLWASPNTPRGAVFQFTLAAHSEITSRPRYSRQV
jgi:PAS domain S-box-containing protein